MKQMRHKNLEDGLVQMNTHVPITLKNEAVFVFKARGIVYRQWLQEQLRVLIAQHRQEQAQAGTLI